MYQLVAMASKYIITRSGQFAIFNSNSTMQHIDVAETISHVRLIVGAGFCSLSPEGQMQCFGQSMSLRIASREEDDADIINEAIDLGRLYLRNLSSGTHIGTNDPGGGEPVSLETLVKLQVVE